MKDVEQDIPSRMISEDGNLRRPGIPRMNPIIDFNEVIEISDDDSDDSMFDDEEGMHEFMETLIRLRNNINNPVQQIPQSNVQFDS